MNTLIFDMGMVLVDYRWKAFLKDLGYEGEKFNKVGNAVFNNPLWQQFDQGVMGDENVIAQMKKESPECAADIDRIWENFRYVCQPYAYSEEMIRTLHEMGYKIYILSNYGKTLLNLDREDFTFLDYVDGGIFSYEVKQVKPNDDIYETLLSKYDICPETAIFFDDMAANCESARRRGITAVEVRGLSSILDGLKEHCHIELPEIHDKYLL